MFCRFKNVILALNAAVMFVALVESGAVAFEPDMNAINGMDRAAFVQILLSQFFQ